MIEELSISFYGFELFLLIIIIAFFCELLDSSLGMGYGTTLTPLLLIIGFQPLMIVPCILLSELITGITAALAHHKAGNVCFKKKSKHLKVASILSLCSIIGSIIAVIVAISIPKIFLKTYIGLMVLSMGLVIILTYNKQYAFSWKKIVGLGSIAAFNKGMSGGGYGPVVTGGQILSGVNGVNAIGITSLSEGLTCLVGVIVFIISPEIINWQLAPSLIIGAMLSIPFSIFIVKKMSNKSLKISIAVFTLILGTYTLINIYL